MPGWIDTQDVLDALGLDATGPNLDRAIPAAEAQVESWRGDITDWSNIKQLHPNVAEAGVQAAALLYQSKASVEGFSGFDAIDGTIPFDGGQNSKWLQIRRLARAAMPKVG